MRRARLRGSGSGAAFALVAALLWIATAPGFAARTHESFRWYPDSTSQPSDVPLTTTERVIVTGVAPTGERLRLRVGAIETLAIADDVYPWTIQMTTVDGAGSGWVQITTTTDKFFLFNGQGTAGGDLNANLLAASTERGIWIEDLTNNLDDYLGSSVKVELDVALESTGAVKGETYSFRVVYNGNAFTAGNGFPVVAIANTDEVAAFNFLRHRAEEGVYANPVPNLNASYQTLLLPVGRADYAGAASGDTLYALSRTSGAVRWSQAQAGRVRGIRRVWSTPDNGYRVFSVVDECMLSAMVDKNGSFTSVSGWLTNPKPFGSSSAFPISNPMIVSETNHLGGTSYYLYIIATTFQSASSSLWKIQADDGQLDSDNGDWPFGPADTGASTRGWSSTAGLNWQSSTFWVTGISDGKSYRITHSPVAATSFHGTNGPTDMQLPPHIATGTTNSRIYLAPVDTFIWKIRSDTMTTPLGNTWDGGSADSNRSSTMVSTNTCSPFGQIGGVDNLIIAGVNNKVYALQGTDGAIRWNAGGIQVSGGPSTGMARRGAFLYFGTDTGWMYKMSATNGTVPTGWPWGAPGSPKVIGCAIDNKNPSMVYFTTDDGRLYCFDP